MSQPFPACNIQNISSVFQCVNSYTGDFWGTGVVFVLFTVAITVLLAKGYRLNKVLGPTFFIMFILTLLLRLLSLVNDFVVVFFGIMTIVSAVVVRYG